MIITVIAIVTVSCDLPLLLIPSVFFLIAFAAVSFSAKPHSSMVRSVSCVRLRVRFDIALIVVVSAAWWTL